MNRAAAAPLAVARLFRFFLSWGLGLRGLGLRVQVFFVAGSAGHCSPLLKKGLKREVL